MATTTEPNARLKSDLAARGSNSRPSTCGLALFRTAAAGVELRVNHARQHRFSNVPAIAAGAA
jgi:hypothetical protein